MYKETKSDDVSNAFKELWQRKDDEIEKEFSIKPIHVFEFFSHWMDQLIKKNELTLVKEYLNNFLAYINNRSIVLLVWPNGTFLKILEWHFRIWEKEYIFFANKYKSSERMSYREIYGTLNSILQKIEERAFKESQSFYFFEGFKEHAEKHKKKFVESEDKSKKYYYINYLFDIFYQKFFEVIESSPERYNIWKFFPEEWKVTKNNITDTENDISRISLNKFFTWAGDRILQEQEIIDRILDDVSRNIFPEVEPVFWARILFFVFSPDGEDKVKLAIERPWTFGYVGRVIGFSGEHKIEIQIKNTFELAFSLFRTEFTKENLEKYISILNELKYEKESKEENKRKRLLAMFEDMLKYQSSFNF